MDPHRDVEDIFSHLCHVNLVLGHVQEGGYGALVREFI